jgi:hypothetical protein
LDKFRRQTHDKCTRERPFTDDRNPWASAVLAKIAALPQPDRAMGERLHAIIKANAPALSPKS